MNEAVGINAFQATFTAMTDGSAEEFRQIGKCASEYSRDLAERVLAHLALLEGDTGGYAIDRLTHSLQTATRAHRAGENEEYVVCALLHDIGDMLGSHNHADVAAAILWPFVSEDNHWLVQQHAIFQGYYFFHHAGLDRDMRERFRGHPCFERTAFFCHQYDQNSFDPEYDTMTIDDFRPMVHRLFSQPRRSIYLPDA